MTVEEAIAIVAERAIWAATREIEWSDYGDIGELDWDEVLAEIDRCVGADRDDPMRCPANLDLYPAAYDLLAARADQEREAP